MANKLYSAAGGAETRKAVAAFYKESGFQISKNHWHNPSQPELFQQENPQQADKQTNQAGRAPALQERKENNGL